MLKNWLKSILPPIAPPGRVQLSKNAQRRLAHTSLVYEGPMRCRDGRVRPVRWLRLDMRYLDRSKY